MTDATLRWLLDGDPAIRWQTLRDLLDEPEDRFDKERAQVAAHGWGAELLACRDAGGTWAGGLYGPKWTSTCYTLLLLWRCGLHRDHPAGRRGAALLWDGARYYDGGLTPAVTIEYPEACVTSMYLTLAAYFGFRDGRVEVALEWLLANQLDDGGWNCNNVRYGDEHSSFHTSISALEALAQLRDSTVTDAHVDDALERGREFFLAHRLFKSHRTGEVADPVFTRLSFPPRWHYDVLRGLDHFRTVDSPWDERFTDAIDLLIGKRRRDGTWPLQHKHSGKTWFAMERQGGPSRWNTLRALRVLRWAELA